MLLGFLAPLQVCFSPAGRAVLPTSRALALCPCLPCLAPLFCASLPVQVVVNNAGIYGRRIDFQTVTFDDMIAAYTTNCIGPLLVVQQLHK